MRSREKDQGEGQRRALPAYARVKAYISELLPKVGHNGARLPTEAELTHRFRVSRQTARRAYMELVAEGLVERTPGKGTFPAQSQKVLTSLGWVDDLIAPVEDREIQVISPLRLVRRAAEATKLGLVGDVIGYVAYRQVHEGVTFGLTRIYHPPSVVDALADVEFLHTEGGVAREFVISMLDRRLPHPIALARQIISAIASPADVAAVLDCPPGKPLLKIEFLYFDTDARPIQLNINFYNPELYEYRAQLRRRPESASSTWATQLGSQIPAGVMPHE